MHTIQYPLVCDVLSCDLLFYASNEVTCSKCAVNFLALHLLHTNLCLYTEFPICNLFFLLTQAGKVQKSLVYDDFRR